MENIDNSEIKSKKSTMQLVKHGYEMAMAMNTVKAMIDACREIEKAGKK